MKSDFHQIARLAIAENSLKYNSEHQTDASFTTFIRSRVCGKLWDERKKHLKWIPFSIVEAVQETQEFVANPLVDGLTAEACQCEGIDETAVRHLDLEKFKTLLPKLLSCLSEKEGMVLKMKFFEELTGVEIAKRLGISEGRVSQLLRFSLIKLKQLYLSEAIGA